MMINEKSTMQKIEQITKDRLFIAQKIVGKEYPIICHECCESVRIIVREDATAICPSCGKINQLTFGVR